MAEVIWEDPPTKPSAASRFERELERVKKKPGKWARVHQTGKRGTASAIATRLRASTSPDEWEFRSGKLFPSNTYGVWARYVG